MRAFRVAYDGRPYRGFQRQPDVTTVEGTLLDALTALEVVEEGTPPGYAAAGRTDAGVSALAQTVAFEAPDWLDPAALNSELPRSVRAWASAPAPADFHATHHASARAYTYYLHRTGPGGRSPDGLDGNRAARALDALAGEHDFHNLTTDADGTERDLSTGLDRSGDFFAVTVRSDGFPRQLVRRLVSVVAAVASGERDLSFVERVLAAAPLSGPDGVGPAPPEPLVLTAVEYPDRSFERDADAAATAARLFEQQRVQQAERAQVADALAAGVANGDDES